MTECISEIYQTRNGIKPIIAQFQNAKVQEGALDHLKIALYKNERNNETIATAAAKEILYTGTVNKEKESLCNNFLLIRSKSTGKVSLVEVDIATFSPHLNLKSPSKASNATVKVLEKSVNELNKQFGSKRTKRMTEQRERMKMDIDNVKEQLEQTVADVEIDETEFSMKPQENDSAYRPPINRSAQKLEEVYDIDELVPKDILDSLEEEAQHYLEADVDESEFTTFIKTHWSDIQNSASADHIEKCKILIYTDYLMKYVCKPAKQLKKVVICQTSKPVNDHILENFSSITSSGRTRPLALRDKAVCYIMVLCMIALDYEINVEMLSKEIKMGVKKLQEMGRILAFSTSAKNKNVMVLKLPLPAPVSGQSRKRKR